jgi:hypothetical protein
MSTEGDDDTLSYEVGVAGSGFSLFLKSHVSRDRTFSSLTSLCGAETCFAADCFSYK